MLFVCLSCQLFVLFGAHGWGGPRDGTDLDVFGVAAPTATPQKTRGGPWVHGPRHPVLFPSSTSCWRCVWVSCLTSVRSFVWVSVHLWGISDVSFAGPSSFAPCSVILVFRFPLFLLSSSNVRRDAVFSSLLVSLYLRLKCWETQNSV